MKKKHYIKTLEDIKYCEEHKRLIFEGVFSDTYKFEDGVWNRYDSDGNLDYYNIGVSIANELYYYEEESEEQQEATEDDVGKLCWCWNECEDNKEISIFDKYDEDDTEYKYHLIGLGYYKHCHRLSPAEVAEITGYGVTEDGSTFYGEPFKPVVKEK